MEFLRPGEVKKVLSARNELPWKSKPLTDEEKVFKDRLGRCYELAYKFIKDHPEAKLIHGSIRGSGEEKRIKHAWCEIGDKVFDGILGKMVPKWLYAEMFNPEPIEDIHARASADKPREEQELRAVVSPRMEQSDRVATSFSTT